MSDTSRFQCFSARLLALIRESASRGDSETSLAECPDTPRFEDLALDLFDLQFENVPRYRQFCNARGISGEAVSHWLQIPAIPTAAFKDFEISSLPNEERTTVFRSSGTTGQQPSRHFHDRASLEVYEMSLLHWFWRCVLYEQRDDSDGADSSHPTGFDNQTRSERGRPRPQGQPIDAWSPESSCRAADGEDSAPGDGRSPLSRGFANSARWRLMILTPASEQAPHSSLVYMFETVKRVFGTADSVFVGEVDSSGAWLIDGNRCLSALEQAISKDEPVVLLGTAFSFVHFTDQLMDINRSLRLPPGSRVMETGGYKGRSRVLSKSELRSSISDRFGIPESNILSEYGMSELSSQAYTRLCRRVEDDRRSLFTFPPWARARIVSPDTGDEVGEGEVGLIRIFDLANVRSVMAVQTEDLGIRRGDEFELVGRVATAEARGCSLMAL